MSESRCLMGPRNLISGPFRISMQPMNPRHGRQIGYYGKKGKKEKKNSPDSIGFDRFRLDQTIAANSSYGSVAGLNGKSNVSH